MDFLRGLQGMIHQPKYVHGQAEAETLDAQFSICSEPSVISDLEKIYRAKPSDNRNRLQYAYSLAHSDREEHHRLAVTHFTYLLNVPHLARDALFNLALVQYKLKEFDAALHHCEDLYRQEPDNPQVRHVHRAIHYKLRQQQQQEFNREAGIGVAVGVGVTAAAVGISMLMAATRKR